MSEEAEIQTNEPTIETPVETAVDTQVNNGRPAGYDPIDFKTASPEQVQERFDYVYGQVKNNERALRENTRTLSEYQRIAAEQSKIINDLTSGFNGVVNHLQTQTLQETEASLAAAKQEAWEKGDTKAYMEADNKLMDLKIQKSLPKQQPQQPQPKQYNNAAEIAKEGGLSDEDYRTTETWQNEKDENGNLIRPWAFNKSNDPANPSPEYRAALVEASAVLNSPRFAGLTYQQKLAEIDKRMGVQKRGVSQSVLGGGLTGARKTGKLTLTPKQQEIAIKTKYAGPQAKPEEHLEAYRKQIEKVNSMKGGRA